MAVCSDGPVCWLCVRGSRGDWEDSIYISWTDLHHFFYFLDSTSDNIKTLRTVGLDSVQGISLDITGRVFLWTVQKATASCNNTCPKSDILPRDIDLLPGFFCSFYTRWQVPPHDIFSAKKNKQTNQSFEILHINQGWVYVIHWCDWQRKKNCLPAPASTLTSEKCKKG